MSAIPEGDIFTLCTRITTNGALERSVSFNIALATADSMDIVIHNDGLITFLPGDDTGAENCIEVMTVNDTILENDEEFQFTIVAGSSNRDSSEYYQWACEHHHHR